MNVDVYGDASDDDDGGDIHGDGDDYDDVCALENDPSPTVE